MSETNSKLYIGGLAWAVKDADLREAFEKAGTVSDAVVMMERDSGRSRGFGFVEMGTAEEAQAAIAMWNEQPLMGRNIMVNVARPKTDRPPRRDFGGGGGGGDRGGFGGGGGGFNRF